MKPVHIVLLVVAGALVGAVVTTRVGHKPQQSKQVAAAYVPAPATPVPAAPAAAAPAVEPEATPVEPVTMPEAQKAAAAAAREAREKPSPVEPPARSESRRETARTAARTKLPPANPRPIETSRVEPMPKPTTVRAPAPTPPPPVAERQPEPAAVNPPVPAPEPVREKVAPPPPAPAPNRATLNAGMLVPVRLIDGLSTERNAAGDTFTATLDRELVADGFVIAERGSRVDGRVVSVERAGKVRGVAAMAIELTRIHTSDGQTVAIQTDAFERHAEASHQTDAAKVGGGAAIGAIIGAIAGGGKGAAIGAGVGGGAGAADVALTRGKSVTFPTETRVSFRLRAPVTITERR